MKTDFILFSNQEIDNNKTKFILYKEIIRKII